MVNEEVKEKAETLIETDQKRGNPKDLSLKTKEAILPEMIRKSKGASDVIKKAISKRLYSRKCLYIS